MHSGLWRNHAPIVSDTRFQSVPDLNTFTDPIAWITTQVPADPLSSQAKNDMTNRALRDSRFVGSGAAYGSNINWNSNYELRWMDFAFVGGRTTRIYQATSKTNRSYRLTIFWDPDRGTWASWVQARGPYQETFGFASPDMVDEGSPGSARSGAVGEAELTLGLRRYKIRDKLSPSGTRGPASRSP